MAALIGIVLVMASILASAVCMLFVLWLLDRERGRLHALLGFFFPPYAYVWAWQNARRLGLTPVLLLWTLFGAASVVITILLDLNYGA